MKPSIFSYFGKVLFLCLFAGALFTACEPEDDDFFDFRPVDFFINADRLFIDVGESITYQDSSATGVSREWMFEGGNPATSSDANPVVTYNEAGGFLTTVTTTFADGSKESRRLQVTVVPLVEADFGAVATQVVAGNPVQFQNLTRGVGEIPAVATEGDTAIIYKWVFEGISTDTIFDNNPQVTYNETGSYDVSLTVVRRATGFTSTEVKEDFIQVVDVPVIGPRTVKFDRDGSSILVVTPEPLAALPGDAASGFSLSGSDGSSVAVSGVSVSAFAANTLVVDYDAASLVEDVDYTLSFDGDLLYASESILAAFDETMTFHGATAAWLDFVHTNDMFNEPIMASSNGLDFTADADGILYAWNCNPAVNVFNNNPAYKCPGYNAGSPQTWVISGNNGATLDDLRDVGFEISFIGPAGTTFTFTQPVTGLRFHNTFGNMEQIPQASISTDGLTVTVDFQGARSGGARITGILEGPISAGGVTISSDAPEDVNTYFSATVK